MTISERARLRLREEMTARKINQRDLSELLTAHTRDTWTQSRLSKLLAGRVSLGLDDLATVAEVLNLHVSELLRDRGLEFYAEMTPSEVRILERIRQRPGVMQALMTIFDVAGTPPAGPIVIKRPPGRRRRGRPKHSERLPNEVLTRP